MILIIIGEMLNFRFGVVSYIIIEVVYVRKKIFILKYFFYFLCKEI